MAPLVPCPDPTCDAPAELIDRFRLPSTGGPVELVRTHCLHRHIFTLPAARVDHPAARHQPATPRPPAEADRGSG
jgi:hypothetical protein